MLILAVPALSHRGFRRRHETYMSHSTQSPRLLPRKNQIVFRLL